VRTKSSSAQSYFDQGMRLLWGFNHDESTRSFARALELDPACAMCAWGVAMTVGPNYNVPMLAAARAKIAFETTKRAQRLAGSSRTVEQALISTLEKRYPNALALDPESSVPVLTAYAAAMRIVARRYPGDLDVQTLYAESLMNIHAWKLWSADGMPAEGTTEIIAELESVLKRDPTHMGALHYYVHAVEASPHPESGLAAAARLRTIAPSAGHLIHMPAHIFHRVGRYEESAEANRRAAAADLAYFAKMSPIDYYPAMYASHNYQFLAYSASAEGREAETIDAVRRSRASVSDSQLQEMPGTDWYVAEIYTAPVRFGRWDLLLAEPAPATGSASLNGGYLYATAVALAASNHPVEARDRLARLDALIASVAPEVPAGQNTLRDVLGVARRVAAARIASEEGHGEDAIRELGEAVALEDGLAYDEPSGWFFPVRHLLGVELLRAGRANDAEITYRDDLLRHPGSGWSLFGLMQALKAERRDAEANDVEREFRIAWTHATISINASAF
jgi:tetratricopeptide (TPR) repeat protein